MKSTTRLVSALITAGISFVVLAQRPTMGGKTAEDAKAMAAKLKAAAARPGDDKLTCEQIHGELNALAMGMGPAADRAGAAAEKVLKKQEEETAKAQAEYAAKMAAANADAAKSSALEMMNPVAAQAEKRRAMALAEKERLEAARRAREAAPMYEEVIAATTSLFDAGPGGGGMARMMELMKLSKQKNCRPLEGKEPPDDLEEDK